MKTVIPWLLIVSAQAAAPHYFLTTAAGANPSISAPIALDQPQVAQLVAYDPAGHLYYTDGQHIWRLNADGTETLIAGSYSTSATFTEGGQAVDATLGGVADFKFDSRGNLYVVSVSAYKVYRVTPDGVIRTFAGTGEDSAFLKSLPPAGPNVPAAQVPASGYAVAIDADDNIYLQIAVNSLVLPYCSEFLSFPPDGSSSAVVAVAVPCQDTIPVLGTPTIFGRLDTMAISGKELYVTLSGISYKLALPGNPNQQPGPLATYIGYAISTGPDGSIVFFTDPGLSELNPIISTVTPLPNSGAVGAGLGLATNPLSGDVAVAVDGVVSVYSKALGTLQPVACNAPLFAGDGGPAVMAALNNAFAVATDANGDIFVADRGNNRIRKISPSGIIATIAGSGAPGSPVLSGDALQAAITPSQLAADAAGNLYFVNNSGSNSAEICKIDTSGKISTVAGGGSGKLVSGASATSVSILPHTLAADSGGDVFFSANDVVYEVSTSGTISAVAGTGTFGVITPGAPANSAGLGHISSLAVDRAGNVYIGDTDHTSIWMVDAQGNLNLIAGNNALIDRVISTLLGAGPAVGVNIGEPDDIVVDSAQNIYFTSLTAETQVLMVDRSGNLAPIGGGGKQPSIINSTSSGDGGDAQQGTFSQVNGLAIGPSGALYIADANLIREMSPYDPASPPPYLAAGGVVGAGGSLPAVAAVSAGGEVSIFGANFVSAANERTVSNADLVNGKIPTMLAGVCASFGGSPAAMLGVYPNQLNVQVGALAPGAVNVQVTTNCGTPQAVTSNYSGVVVQTASPEFYSFAPDPMGGRNPIAAVNAITGAFIGPPNLLPGAAFVAAKAGDIVQAYATGFGATNPAYGLGVIPGAAGTLTNPYSLTLGGVPIPTASIEYAGISPCCAGFYQIDFTVPSGIPSGAQPLIITIAGQPSPPEAYIQIGQ